MTVSATLYVVGLKKEPNKSEEEETVIIWPERGEVEL